MCFPTPTQFLLWTILILVYNYVFIPSCILQHQILWHLIILYYMNQWLSLLLDYYVAYLAIYDPRACIITFDPQTLDATCDSPKIEVPLVLHIN